MFSGGNLDANRQLFSTLAETLGNPMHLGCFQGGGRVIKASVCEILSTFASSKVNYSCSIQP